MGKDEGQVGAMVNSKDHMTADVVVVVVLHNSSETLPATLDALQSARESVPSCAVVVVDNDSSDDSVAIADRHPAVDKVIATGANGGYAAGINIGARAIVPTHALLAMNADAVMHPTAIFQMLAALDRPAEPRAGIIAPRIVDESGRLKFSLRRDPSILRALLEALLGGHRAGRLGLGEEIRDPRAYVDGAQADWATGAVLMVSADCGAEVGPWDESFFLYSEETDYAMRARERGWSVRFADRAVVYHPGGAMEVSSWLWSILAYNRVKLFRKYHSALATGCYRVVVLLNEALRVRRPTNRAAFRTVLSGRAPYGRRRTPISASAE